MASRHYIKFDGVEGESTSKDHKGEIEVLSWAWGLSAGASGSGSGASTSRPKAGDFTFTHLYDKASPVLAKAVATGKAIKHVLMSSRKAGSSQKDVLKDFLKVSMKDVVVMSVEQVADEATGITETVTLSSRTVSFEYRPATTTGSLGDPVTFDWDGVKSK